MLDSLETGMCDPCRYDVCLGCVWGSLMFYFNALISICCFAVEDVLRSMYSDVCSSLSLSVSNAKIKLNSMHKIPNR